MKQTLEILKQFTVRIKDGKEVEKPDYKDDYYRDANGVTQNFYEDLEAWMLLNKVIKLPTKDEFDDYLDSIKLDIFLKWKYSREYAKFLKTQLSKGQFVNELVEPKPSDFGIYGIPYSNYPDELPLLEKAIEEFQKAEDLVIFIDTRLFDPLLHAIMTFSELSEPYTVNQALNSHVVLYMKIKQ